MYSNFIANYVRLQHITFVIRCLNLPKPIIWDPQRRPFYTQNLELFSSVVRVQPHLAILQMIYFILELQITGITN